MLLVGGRVSELVERLSARGYECDSAASGRDVARAVTRGRPDVVVLASGRSAAGALKAVRAHAGLRGVPVLVDGSGVGPAAAGRLDVDGIAADAEDLERKLAASLVARRHVDRESLVRRRLELLLEITRATASRRPTAELVPTVAGKLTEALACDQVSVLQLEGTGPRLAWLVDGAARRPVDLAVSPMLRRALETREPVAVEGIWVQPLPGELFGAAALVLKRSTPLQQEELDFLSAVGVALGNAVEHEQASAVESRTRESLEVAYVDRYKELVEANQRLKTLDRHKNELMAVLSHDLRAPLNVLLGHAHLLLSDRKLLAEHKVSAEAMQRTGRKILELVERLLDQARGDDGRIVLFTRTMDVAETVQEAVKDLQILASERGVTLRAEAPMSLLVLGDEQKVRQVLQNLVTNALTHAKDAKTVVVRAVYRPRPDGDVAHVEVRDDGVVKDPDDVLLAFERSRGLGLSICRDYVERHGGEIWAEAPQEGGGAFIFDLPIKREETQPRRQQDDTSAVPLVLLAEDDPVFARVTAMGLSGHYRVEQVRDGNEAVARARALLPDVIVMDVFMPNRDGLDALRELQKAPETASIPVLLLSGHQDLGEKLGSLDLGPVDFLVKPFALATLVTRVGEAMRRSRTLPLGATPGNDPETGLFNHLGIVTRLDQELSRSGRYRRPLTVAVLRPTMPPGEKTRALAAAVRRELRVPDVVGHLGGGALAVLIPETPLDAARPLIARLCRVLEAQGVSYDSRCLDVREEAIGAEALLERLMA